MALFPNFVAPPRYAPSRSNSKFLHSSPCLLTTPSRRVLSLSSGGTFRISSSFELSIESKATKGSLRVGKFRTFRWHHERIFAARRNRERSVIRGCSILSLVLPPFSSFLLFAP